MADHGAAGHPAAAASDTDPAAAASDSVPAAAAPLETSQAAEEVSLPPLPPPAADSVSALAGPQTFSLDLTGASWDKLSAADVPDLEMSWQHVASDGHDSLVVPQVAVATMAASVPAAAAASEPAAAEVSAAVAAPAFLVPEATAPLPPKAAADSEALLPGVDSGSACAEPEPEGAETPQPLPLPPTPATPFLLPEASTAGDSGSCGGGAEPDPAPCAPQGGP